MQEPAIAPIVTTTTSTTSTTTASTTSSTNTDAGPSTTGTSPTVVDPFQVDRGDVAPEFPIGIIAIDGEEFVVARADDPGLRSRGLMGVEDLGDLDGMLFVFEQEQQVSFWMKDTLIPLDIAFFGESGDLISVETMVPCVADPCPSYGSDGAALYAVEVPAGAFAGLDGGAVLSIGWF